MVPSTSWPISTARSSRQTLLFQLGHDERGWHPEGRRLVFLGDLTDRGPDSPAVVALVRRLVEVGHAQCVLGNHELNLMRGQAKHGNAWFEASPRRSTTRPDRPPGLADEGREILRFFRQLPLALEREDLRVVHACWDSAMVDLARDATDISSCTSGASASSAKTSRRVARPTISRCVSPSRTGTP